MTQNNFSRNVLARIDSTGAVVLAADPLDRDGKFIPNQGASALMRLELFMVSLMDSATASNTTQGI
jgi:hypothetical protein